MANVVIDIAAEFTGGNAFRKAESATDKLSKTAGKLGKAFIGLYSTQKLLAFGKASIQAAAQDEKAQKQLALALKNVGLGRDVALSEAYIQRLQKEFGVLDDDLRPAYQTLAVATQNTAESQRLFQIALDISASKGLDLGTVTNALSKAFLGNNTALSKLGVGISKADLKTESFESITKKLAKTFAGSATESANSLQGSMDKLAVASSNAKEIIGKGLIDALDALGGEDAVDDLAKNMEFFAQGTADAISGLGILFAKLRDNSPILDKFFNFAKNAKGVAQALGEAARIEEARAAAAATYAEYAAANGNKLSFAAGFPNAKVVGYAKVLTAEELRQLKAKQLKLAIDKASLALNKGSNVFDIEKIQLAAAEKSAAEQLGKVTSKAQLLQITNDLARLEVKQSILALDEAIASKDVAAITAATNKLNADLGILGTLTKQDLKLKDIKSILDSILPKDLINLANLDAAIAKLKFIGGGGTTTAAMSGTGTGAGTPTLLESLAAGSFAPVTGGGYSSTAGNYASSGFPGAEKNGGVTVVVNAGTIANPDELTSMIQNAVISLNKRGDLLTTAGAL